ncbi:cell division protein FtsZ [Rickettsia canadensis str. CA410]|uniref:Cell division protein FtsZ n=1 Tax=Rickettsia canadensis str. CA410 TaxID=1105107 RepID=A0ABN4ABK7_RICCA|nr:cell division protein FtsZ [Rickettsia canadensis str. CA410]
MLYGEIIGAELYITEITSHPIQYPAVAIISIFTVFRSFAVLWGLLLIIFCYKIWS